MILGLDPGTRKCGYALLTCAGDKPLALGIAPLADLEAVLRGVVAAQPVERVALGRGTNAAVVGAVLDRLGLPYSLVDEHETTLRARARYFADHPPRGWKRLIPRGMLLPERPVDDYAALLIAERYFAATAAPENT
jgi:RNase H-fold protein (predicted Holliday junction resolvase)